MNRNEIAKKIYGYFLVTGVMIWGLFCFLCPLIHPDTLSSKDCNEYQQIASSYLETGEYDDANSFSVSKNSANSVSVSDKSRPFSASLIFVFSEEGVKTKYGINLNFLKMVVPSLIIFTLIMMVIATIITVIVFLFSVQKEKG